MSDRDKLIHLFIQAGRPASVWFIEYLNSRYLDMPLDKSVIQILLANLIADGVVVQTPNLEYKLTEKAWLEIEAHS